MNRLALALGAALVLVGIATYAWFIIGQDEHVDHMGLWRIERCDNGVCDDGYVWQVLADADTKLAVFVSGLLATLAAGAAGAVLAMLAAVAHRPRVARAARIALGLATGLAIAVAIAAIDSARELNFHVGGSAYLFVAGAAIAMFGATRLIATRR